MKKAEIDRVRKISYGGGKLEAKIQSVVPEGDKCT